MGYGLFFLALALASMAKAMGIPKEPRERGIMGTGLYPYPIDRCRVSPSRRIGVFGNTYLVVLGPVFILTDWEVEGGCCIVFSKTRISSSLELTSIDRCLGCRNILHHAYRCDGRHGYPDSKGRLQELSLLTIETA
ncbi:hypothetical protein QBC39DRAFT_56701 [Podospora conica]|nr:hypothetical protein QBC39DRAFT_56701 [Schizothecium conicum]